MLIFKANKFDSKTPCKWIIGELSEYKNDKVTLIEKQYKITKDTDKKVVVSYICQSIAEGHSLERVLSKNDWCPSLYLFHLWLDADDYLTMLYHRAKVIRTKHLVERLYESIEDSPSKQLTPEQLKETTSVLMQITKLLAKEVEDEDKNIVTIEVINHEAYKSSS